MTKNEFMQKCFKELLSDGQPHRYRSIFEYTVQQSQGTAFEGLIDKASLINGVRACITEPTCYARVKYGVYQMKPPDQIPSILKPPTLHPMLKIGFDKIERLAAELQKEMKDTFTVCFLTDKDQAVQLEKVYNRACENLERAITGMRICRFFFENPEATASSEQQENLTMDETIAEDAPSEENGVYEDEESTENEEAQDFGLNFGGM